MASATNQRLDVPTQASPSRPPDWSAVKQWEQHTSNGGTETNGGLTAKDTKITKMEAVRWAAEGGLPR